MPPHILLITRRCFSQQQKAWRAAIKQAKAKLTGSLAFVLQNIMFYDKIPPQNDVSQLILCFIWGKNIISAIARCAFVLYNG